MINNTAGGSKVATQRVLIVTSDLANTSDESADLGIWMAKSVRFIAHRDLHSVLLYMSENHPAEAEACSSMADDAECEMHPDRSRRRVANSFVIIYNPNATYRNT